MKAIQFEILVLLIVCFASQLFSENHPSNFQIPFVGKILGAVEVIHAIQTKDGNYTFLNGFGPAYAIHITQVSNVSGKKVSEVSLGSVVGYLAYLSLRGMAQTSSELTLVGYIEDGYYRNTDA